MSIEIFMPALSPTMEKGTLAKWLVKEGDKVESGDVLAEIETDKATMEVESIDDGTVAKILIEEGAEDVPVGEIIAILAEEGEDVGDVKAPSSKKDAAPTPAPESEKEAEPKAEKAPEPAGKSESASVPQSAPHSASKSASQDSVSSERVKASPLARRIADQKGLSLSGISGSGPYGRIIKRDIEGAKAGVPASSESLSSASQPVALDGDAPFRTEKLSGMRKVIAKRLTESKQTVPHFYLTVEIALDKLMASRKELNSHLEAEGIKLSVNDFIIKASAMALKKVPAANVQYGGDSMRWYDRADISVAVAIEGGLITPVVRGACTKSISAIALEVKDLATRARDGKLAPDEYTGGTFSISNLGMFGIKEFSAVINPPQGAILAVGAGEQRAVVKDGEVVAATMMNCTLSCDHRAIDGAVGSEFLKAFKGFLENPITMMV